MELTMPWPPKLCSPNARVHWGRKARAQKALKEAWFYQAKEQGAQPIKADRLEVSLEFHCPDRRARDMDNMLSSCKSGLDGLAMALGVDDSRWDIKLSRAGTVGGFVKVRVAKIWRSNPALKSVEG